MVSVGTYKPMKTNLRKGICLTITPNRIHTQQVETVKYLGALYIKIENQRNVTTYLLKRNSWELISIKRTGYLKGNQRKKLQYNITALLLGISYYCIFLIC